MAGSSAGRGTVVEFPVRPRGGLRRWWRWLVAGLVALALVVGGLVLYFSPVLEVREVNVEGTRHVAADEVAQSLSSLRGTPLPQISRGRVQELAGQVPGVDEVDMVASPPHGLDVTVREHRPVGRADSDADRLLLADGSVVEGAPDGQEGDRLAVVSDEVLEGDRRTRRSVAGVVTSLPSEVAAQVSSVTAERPRDIRLTLDTGLTVVWGEAEETRTKTAVLETMLKDDGGSSLESVEELDLSVPERPVTR